MLRTRRASDQTATVAFSQVTDSRVHQLLHNYLASIFTAPGVTTWSDMSGNTRKNQVTRLVTLRHRSIMSGALSLSWPTNIKFHAALVQLRDPAAKLFGPWTRKSLLLC